MKREAPEPDRPRIYPLYRHRKPPEYMTPEIEKALAELTNRAAWREAAELSQELTLQPHPPLEAWFLVAMCRRREGQYEQAEAAVAYALAREPGYSAAWQLQSRIQLAQYAYDDALQSIYMAISLTPGFCVQWYLLHKIYKSMGHYDAARLALAHSRRCNTFP